MTDIRVTLMERTWYRSALPIIDAATGQTIHCWWTEKGVRITPHPTMCSCPRCAKERT